MQTHHEHLREPEMTNTQLSPQTASHKRRAAYEHARLRKEKTTPTAWWGQGSFTFTVTMTVGLEWREKRVSAKGTE